MYQPQAEAFPGKARENAVKRGKAPAGFWSVLVVQSAVRRRARGEKKRGGETNGRERVNQKTKKQVVEKGAYNKLYLKQKVIRPG